MPQVAERLLNMPAYAFAEMSDQLRTLAAAGKHVIRLDIGSPDLPPPDAVVETLAESAHQHGKHGYSGYRGTPAYRQAIAQYVQQRFDVTLDPDMQVLPLLGSKEGIVNLSMAYLDASSTSLVPDIGYPSYAMGARLAGTRETYVPLRPENSFVLDTADIAADAAARARLLWVNYPNNPTGQVASVEQYRQWVDFCREHDIVLASDNPYVDVTYDDVAAPSALQADPQAECTVEFISFSKTFNMAGWRLGAAIGNAAVLDNLLQVKSNVDSGHFIPVYDAGICALSMWQSQWISDRNHIYQQRRDRIMAHLSEVDLSAGTPGGAMYVWARMDDDHRFGIDSETFTQRARTEALVSLAPGHMYGPGGEGYVRFSVSTPVDQIDAAFERLAGWYQLL